MLDYKTPSNPIVTVLLPAYNAEKYIRESIDSILNQTFIDFELLIINDGSIDKTEEIILSYNDSRIRYIKNETNLKLIKSLNKGVSLSRGKYIARMDADDISLPDRLKEQVEFMENHNDVAVCSSLMYLMTEKGIRQWNYYPAKTSIGCAFCSIYRTPLAHPAAFFRAEILKKYQYTDSKDSVHIEAFVLWGDLALNNEKMYVIQKYLVKYRQNKESVSWRYMDFALSNHSKQVQKMLKKMVNINVPYELCRSFFTYNNINLKELNDIINVIVSSYYYFIRNKTLTEMEIIDLKIITKTIILGSLKKKIRYSSFITKIWSISKFIQYRYIKSI